jgi:hypothetical protein
MLSPTVDASAAAAPDPEPSVLARAKLSFLRLQPALPQPQESVADGGRSAAATGTNAQPLPPLTGLLTNSCIALEDYVEWRDEEREGARDGEPMVLPPSPYGCYLLSVSAPSLRSLWNQGRKTTGLVRVRISFLPPTKTDTGEAVLGFR